MKRRYFLYYSLLFTTGCTAAISSSKKALSPVTGNAPNKLRFAVTDRKGMEEVQRDYEPFRQALEKTLGKKIEFFPVDNYVAAASALQLDQVDLVMAGASEYVVIRSRTNAVPLVSLNRKNYRSVVAVRADSGIKSIAQLKGKKIAMGEVGGTASHIAPTKFLINAGLNPETDVQIVMAGSGGSRGLQELRDRQVDAWGGVFHRYEKYLKSEGLTEQDLPLILTGPPLPGDVFVANSKLDPKYIQEIQSKMLSDRENLMQAIQSTPNNKKFKEGKLEKADDAEYDLIREVYKAIGQDIFIE